MKKLIALMLLLFTSMPLSGQSKENRAEGSRAERFRRGEIITDGGYLKKKGVWGEMQGVVNAPPKVVWRLFVHANEWPQYKLPQLLDCRAVSDEIRQLLAAASASRPSVSPWSASHRAAFSVTRSARRPTSGCR